MCKTVLNLILMVLLVATVANSYAVTIDVPNGDFESPVVAGTAYYDIAGWTGDPDTWWGLEPGGPTGQYALVTQQSGGIWFDAVDGTTTSILAEAHQDITLNFDAACTWGTGYPLGLEVFTDSGTIATLSVYPGAANQNWASYSETLSWTGNAVGIGEQLKVLFTTYNGGYVYFDNVSGDIVSVASQKANTPIPTDNETDVLIDLALLEWSDPNYIGATYDVYLGTTEPNALLANYGLTQLADGTSATSTDPTPAGDLDYGTIYHWVVDTYEPNTPSPVFHPGDYWSFTTEDAPVSLDPSDYIVKPASVTATGEVGYSFDAVIDNSGLSSTLNTLDPIPAVLPTHTVHGAGGDYASAGGFWNTTDKVLVFDLGSTYTIDGVLFWNGTEVYLGANYNERGMSQVTLSFSADDVTYSGDVIINPDRVPDTLEEPFNGEVIVLGVAVTDVRYVKFSDMTSFTNPNYGFISEVRFAGFSLLPTVALHPVSQTVPAGDPVVLTSAGANVSTYQWHEETAGALSDAGKFSGVTTDTLTITDVQLAEEGYYYCVLGNGTPAEDVTTDSARVLTERMMAYWDFEGDLTDEVESIIGTYKDADDTSQTPTYDIGGISGQAFSFDSNAYFVEADIADYFEFFGRGMTVSAWVKVPAEHTGFKTYLSKVPTVKLEVSGWSTVAATGAQYTTSAEVLDDLGWHMTTVTFDPSTGKVRHYVDGVFAEYDKSSLDASDGVPVIFGALDTDGTNPYTGLLDEVEIYSYALDATAIANNYLTLVPDGSICFSQVGLEFDLSGPAGVPDCEVNLYDFAALAAEWLNCNRMAGVSSPLADCL